MIFYALVLVVFTCGCLIINLLRNKKVVKNSRKAYIIFSGVYFTVLSGLRNIDVGTDVLLYKTLFNAFGESSLLEELPNNLSGFWGYRLLSKLIYILFNGNYQIMIFVSSVIVIYGFFKFIYYKSDNVLASIYYFILLFYLFMTWNVVRQSIAMSVILLAILAFDDNKKVKGMILSILALSIHSISILMLFYLVVHKLKWSKQIFCMYTASLVFITYFVNALYEIIISIFPRYARYVSAITSGNLNSFGGAARGRKIVLSLVFLLLVIFVLAVFNRDMFKPIITSGNNFSAVTRAESLWTYMSLIMIDIVIGVMYSTNTLYLRVQSFFSVFSIFFIPGVVERVDEKWRLMLYLISNLLFLATIVIRLQSNEAGVFPYEFFFNS